VCGVGVELLLKHNISLAEYLYCLFVRIVREELYKLAWSRLRSRWIAEWKMRTDVHIVLSLENVTLMAT